MGRWLLRSDYLALLLCLALVAIASPTVPGFASTANMANVLAVAAPLTVLALGQMLVMISGGIDLSVTAVMAITSVLGASLMTEGGPLEAAWPLAVLLMPLAGLAIGAVTGGAVAVLAVPSFIATLTAQMFWYGMARWLTGSQLIGDLPGPLTDWGNRNWVVVPLAAALMAATAAGLGRSKYGRWLYAAGQNPKTAEVSGVPVRRVHWVVYALSGMFAGVASVLLTAQSYTGSPVLGENMLLDVIGAVVIGGTSLFGGRGRVSWTLGGVLFLALLDNVLNLQGLSYFAVMIAKGGLILAAALVDSLRHRLGDAA